MPNIRRALREARQANAARKGGSGLAGADVFDEDGSSSTEDSVFALPPDPNAAPSKRPRPADRQGAPENILAEPATPAEAVELPPAQLGSGTGDVGAADAQPKPAASEPAGKRVKLDETWAFDAPNAAAAEASASEMICDPNAPAAAGFDAFDACVPPPAPAADEDPAYIVISSDEEARPPPPDAKPKRILMPAPRQRAPEPPGASDFDGAVHAEIPGEQALSNLFATAEAAQAEAPAPPPAEKRSDKANPLVLERFEEIPMRTNGVAPTRRTARSRNPQKVARLDVSASASSALQFSPYPDARNGVQALLDTMDERGMFFKEAGGTGGNAQGGGPLNILSAPPAAPRPGSTNPGPAAVVSSAKFRVARPSRTLCPKQLRNTGWRAGDSVVEIRCSCAPEARDPTCKLCQLPRESFGSIFSSGAAAGGGGALTSVQKRNATIDRNAEDAAIDKNTVRLAYLKVNTVLSDEQALFNTRASARDSKEQALLDRCVIDVWTEAGEKKDAPALLAPAGGGGGAARIPPETAAVLKNHQIEGLRFLWKNTVVVERRFDAAKRAAEEWTAEAGAPTLGCILAHSMGLGKTAQVIIYLLLLFRYAGASTALVVAPKSTMSNWRTEFDTWSKRCPITRGGPVQFYAFPDHTSTVQKLSVARTWHTLGGVLVIGYEQYASLTGSYGSRNNLSDKQLQAGLTYLRDPGPDVVICDEGHIIRHSTSAISRALNAIRTPKRVVLTGTPLQNHLVEYWTMVEFIRPGYFPRKEFIRYFQTPMVIGQKSNAPEEAIAVMKKRAFILQKELAPFVHRRSQSILQESLPRKYEFVVFCPLSDVQKQVYDVFREAYTSGPEAFHKRGQKNILYFISVMNKLGGHPDLLRQQLLEKQTKLENGEDIEAGSFDWAADLLLHASYQPHKLFSSPKLMTLLYIVEYCVKRREKLIIFSQYVRTLDFLALFVAKLTKGKNTFRLDGTADDRSRAASINGFQAPSNDFAIFFVSTRAGGVGINLNSAHKAVLFDVSFNPAMDQQAIFRCYRYGLKHPVCIYRLVSEGTPEAQIFSSCISKEWMAKKVIDNTVPSRQNIKGTNLEGVYDDLTGLLDAELESPVLASRMKAETSHCLKANPLLAHISNQMTKRGIALRRVFRHESLLLDDLSESHGHEESQAYEEYVKGGGMETFKRDSELEIDGRFGSSVDDWSSLTTRLDPLEIYAKSLAGDPDPTPFARSADAYDPRFGSRRGR
ncbi:Protein CHROMATIN REMODELING 20 [Diplonema papillatum]|nr:Protein CHROMATIN REMODELING 20 [Diplonema papillatum]